MSLDMLQRSAVETRTGAKVLATTVGQDEAEWLAGRREGIGGSDAAAILGVSPWTSGYSLWKDKTDPGPPTASDRRVFRAGHHLEPWILSEAMREDPRLRIVRAPFQLQSREHPHMLVNLDGLADHPDRSGPGIAEAKMVHSRQAHHWSDGMPAYYEAQLVHAFAVCPNIRWAVLVAWFGGDDLRLFWHERDDDMVAYLTGREADWWQRHVIDGDEPDVDGHPATTEALMVEPSGRRLEVEGSDLTMVRSLLAELVVYETAQEKAEARIEAIKNEIRALMGDATELADAGGTTWATWKPTDGRTNWKAVAEELADGKPLDDLAARHKTPTRPLSLTKGRNIIKKETAA